MSEAEVLKEIEGILEDYDGNPEDLNLDDLEIGKFTKAIAEKIEKIKDLQILSLNGCSLENLQNFPSLPNLVRLELLQNKFDGAELKNLVGKIPKVKYLFIGENEIKDIEHVTVLKDLKELTHLDISGTPVSELKDYREKLFKAIPTLEVLDGADKDGNPVEDEEEEEGDEDEDEEDQYEPEGDDDDDEEEYNEDEDEEEEFETKKKKKGKK